MRYFLILLLPLLISCGAKVAGTVSETSTGTSVSGVIQDKDGETMPNTNVFLRSSDYSVNPLDTTNRVNGFADTATTDTDGFFNFELLDTGTFTVEASPDSSRAAITHIDKQTDLDIDLQALVLAPTGSISGQLQSKYAKLGNTVIQVPGTDRYIIPDSSGSFAISGLAKGNYSLRAFSLASIQDTTYLDEVSVTSGQTTTDIDLKLQVTGNSVSGIIKNNNGLLMPNVQVFLHSPDYSVNPLDTVNRITGFADTTLTNTAGFFNFELLDTGTFNLEAIPDSSQAIRVIIKKGTNIDIDLQTLATVPTGSISGKVQSKYVKLGNTIIQVMGTGKHIIPDSLGSYVISGVAQGTYQLRAFSLEAMHDTVYSREVSVTS
ncbi:MAG: carboxypeptidase regulatory-like domain-containing protein, partial [Fibrobacteria bacterium]|nr:carboxypeptidase regulatory-like domain-containing protein [Fibrobacteria bacterium]